MPARPTRPNRLPLAAALLAGALGGGPLSPRAEPGDVPPFDARVVQTSGFPKPVGNPYKDCLFTVKAEAAGPDGKPRPVVLALFAFTNRVLTAESRLRAGDLLRVRAREFEAMPEPYRENQMQDDIAELELPLLAVRAVERIPALTLPLALSSAPATRETPVLRAVTQTPAAAAARAARVAADLAALRAGIVGRPDWAAWHASLAPLRDDLRARLQAAPGGFLRRGNLVFEHLPVLEYTLEDGDPWYQGILRAFSTLQEQFARAGTDLILLPVPQRDDICAPAFLADPPADGVVQPYWLKFHHDLLARGIEVIDLAPAFRERLHTHPSLYIHAVRDGHPGPDGVELMASAVAERLSRYPFAAPRHPYRLDPGHPLDTRNDLYFPIDAPIPFTRVLETDGRPALADPASELLLIGDSMVTVPLGAESGTFGVHLAEKCGVPVAPFKRAGSGHMMSRHLGGNLGLDHFAGRRVCVFVFTTSYLNRRPQAWSALPFLDLALDRACGGERAAAWARATDFAALREPAALARFFGSGSEPLPPAVGGGVRLHGREFPFPPWLAGGERALLVRVQIRSAADARWTLVEGGGREQVLDIPAGLSLVTVSLGPAGPGFRGLRMPDGETPPEIFTLLTRWSTPEGTLRPDDPATTRRLARYNSAEDFRLLRLSPAEGAAFGDTLVLGAGAREVSLATRLRKTGAFPDTLLLEAEAAAPAEFTLLCDGREVARIPVPDFPSAQALTIPRGETLTLRVPAAAGRDTLRNLELRARQPAAPAP